MAGSNPLLLPRTWHSPCSPWARGCSVQSACSPPRRTCCMCPWNLIVFWDWCSWRSWKRCGGGCWTCSATQGSRGSGRRADSGSQGTLTSPQEGSPRILHAPRLLGRGTRTWCTCFLRLRRRSSGGVGGSQLRLQGTGWRSGGPGAACLLLGCCDQLHHPHSPPTTPTHPHPCRDTPIFPLTHSHTQKFWNSFKLQL